ncbi:EAL domain-containing protein [Ruminococcus sp.]|uniref:EAL domain-containing protein n=1 Tax=Ruminococcus sp. TaxID=41978 RepID=UPI003AAD3F16
MENKLWQSYFGAVWGKVCSIWHNIGGFVMDEKSGEFYADENCRALMGLRENTDYDKFRDIVALNGGGRDLGLPLCIELLDTPSGITAGIVYLSKEYMSKSVFEGFDIIPQSELVRLLDGMTRSSLLALVRFDGAGKLLDSDYCIGEALKAVVAVMPENTVTAFNSDGQFWIYVPRFEGKPEEFADNIRKAVKECCLPDEFGVRSSSNHSLSVTAGISSGFEVPARLMHAAGFALYEAKAKGAGSICCFDPEKYAKQKSDIENIRAFSELLDKNLFTYHFQPIVSSSTGEIVAYEALMRTKGNIALNPLQILNCAKNFGRLYDIEKATLKNTLKYLSKHQLDFENRRLYINSISSHALDDKDFYAIVNDYGELLEKVVIEMTEQTEISEDDLDRIRVRLEKNNMSLAIDDYGTGYSNTSNLLRYDPEVVKIDRSLISGIDQNPKAQKIVSKMVEYFHSSGYTALAEGVETSEELKTMIYFGVDLIQGYYVSKPKPVLIHDISENIREEIVAYSIEAGDKDKKVFHAEDNDVIDLAEMYKKRYSDIFLGTGTFTLSGKAEDDCAVPLSVTIGNGVDCVIHLKNAWLTIYEDLPIIKLGTGSRVRIVCSGEDHIDGRGIYVPEGSSLELVGSGELYVRSESKDCYAIGTDSRQPCGRITVAMTGILDITANGDKCVGIGGGGCKDGIVIAGGDIAVNCSGDRCVGIGSIDGDADVTISNCGCRLKLAAGMSVGIGAVKGSADISISDYNISCVLSGNNLTAVGVMSNGTGKICILDGRLNISMKGRTLNCVGTRGGKLDCELENTVFTLYCEGGSVSGVGDKTGKGDVTAKSCQFDVMFLTGDGWEIGSPEGMLSVVDCKKNIKINE